MINKLDNSMIILIGITTEIWLMLIGLFLIKITCKDTLQNLLVIANEVKQSQTLGFYREVLNISSEGL